MGFPRLGFLGGLLLTPFAALFGGGAAASNDAFPISMAPGLDPATGIIVRRSSGHSYGATPGGRAHKRWRKARSSGRHDFRRTLRKAA